MVQHRPGALPRIRSTVVGIPAGLPAPPAGPRALRPFGTRALKIPDSGGLLRGQLTVPCPWWAASGAPSRSLPVLEGAEAGAPLFSPGQSLQCSCAALSHHPWSPLPTFGCCEHGGGQLALLRLQVPQGEPAWVSAGDHRDEVVGVSHITGWCCGLQDRQPEGQMGGGNIRPQPSPSFSPSPRGAGEAAARLQLPAAPPLKGSCCHARVGAPEAACSTHGHGDQSQTYLKGGE